MHALHRTLVFTGALGLASVALAGFTSPKLVVLDAAGVLVDGGRSVTIHAGELDFSNVVQGGTFAHLVIFQGNTFVRYPLGGSAVTGTTATTLGDNQITDLEVPTLLAEGSPAAAGVRIVSITATQMIVTLPATFASGTTYAELFAVLPPPEGPKASVAVDFTQP